MKKSLLRRDRRAGYKNRHGDEAKSLPKEGTLGTGSEEGPSAGSGRRGRRGLPWDTSELAQHAGPSCRCQGAEDPAQPGLAAGTAQPT